MPTKERILVTGAGGFIGGWLVETLYLSGRADVRAGIHQWSGAARLARFPLEIALCDVLNPGQITEALSGVGCVIHCAKGSRESMIQGTQNMLEASLRQGIRRFVHISTTEVYGNPSGEVDERLPCQKTGQPYGDAKIEVEKLCLGYGGKGLPVTVIRPPIVYGPLSKTWTVEIALKLHSKKWHLFKSLGEGKCNLIYISDLVSGILLAAHDEQAAGETFNLNGPEVPTWNEYFQRFNAALGLPPLSVMDTREASMRATVLEPLRPVAKFAKRHFEDPIKKVAASWEPAKRVLKSVEQTLKTTPRATDFSLYNRSAIYTAAKAQIRLGFQPRFDVETGLDLAVRWLDQVGLVTSHTLKGRRVKN